MGSSLVQAQEVGAKSAGPATERGRTGEPSETLANSGLTWQEQKAARLAACERDRNESREDLQIVHKAQMGVCRAQMANVLGRINEQGKQFLFETAGWGAGNCATRLTRDFLMMNEVFDKRRDACLLAAGKD